MWRFFLCCRLSLDSRFTGETQKGAEKDRYNLNDPFDFQSKAQAAEGVATKAFGKGRKVMATRKAMSPRIQQVTYMVV